MKKLFSMILTLCLFVANRMTAFALSVGLDDRFPKNQKVGSIFGEGSVLILVILVAVIVLAVLAAVVVRRKKNSPKPEEPKEEKEE